VAGGEGFEPSTPNLGGWCSIRTELLAHVTVKVDLAKQIPIDTLFRIEKVAGLLEYSILEISLLNLKVDV
jgi:hypothetical protein